MFQNLFASIFAFIPVIGPIIGNILGALLDGDNKTTVTTFGPRITDFNALLSKYGIPIPKGYGTYRFPGNVIWASDVTETATAITTCSTTGGFFGIGGQQTCIKTVTFDYFQSFAYCFAEGDNAKLVKIWANGKLLVDLSSSNSGNAGGFVTTNFDVGTNASFKFYLGNNTAADPTILAAEGADSTPIYKELIYIVFTEIDLRDFGFSMPVLSAEIAYDNSGTDVGTAVCALPSIVAPTGVVAVNSEQVFTQDSSNFEVYNLLGPNSVVSYPFIANTQFPVPYADKYGNVYSSSLYNGTDAELIQYDSLSGDAISRRSLELAAGPLKAITFDYSNALIFGISDTASFYFDIFPGYTNPVVTVLDLYTRLKTSQTLLGDTAKDIYYSNGSVYAVRSNAANPKETYLIIYKESASYEGTVYGPLTHASHTNAFDSSTTLEDGDFITVVGGVSIIGSSSADWLVSVSDSGTVLTYSSAYTISSADRSNFISSVGSLLYLASGSVINLPDLTLQTSYNIDTFFSVTAAHAAWVASLNGYALFTASTNCSGTVRVANNGTQDIQSILNDMILDPQKQVGPKLVAADLDFTSLVPGTYFTLGYSLTQQNQVSQFIDPFRQIFAFEVVESDGKLKSVIRGLAASAAITEQELSSTPENRETLITINRVQESEMVESVSITFSDKAQDYQDATEEAIRLSTTAVDKHHIKIDMVRASTDMKQSAEVILADSWVGREKYVIALPRKYSFLNPADIIDFTTDEGDLLSVRIDRMTWNTDGSINIDGAANKPGIYSSNAVGAVTGIVPQTLSGFNNISVNALEIPFIYPNNNTGTYSIFVAANSSEALNYNITAFKTASILGSNVASGTSTAVYTNTLDPVGVVTDFSFNGTSTAALLSNSNYNDFDTSITVQITNGTTLSDVTDAETMFNNQQNFALIGNELIYYKDVTDLGNFKYQLTGLYRDRQGLQVPSHFRIGENFRVIDRDSFTTLLIGENFVNSPISYLASLAPDYYNKSPTVTHIYEGISAKPLPPSGGTAVDSSGNVLVNWVRRDRLGDNWTTYTGLPLNEITEEYTIDILDDTATVVRTATVTSPTYTYLNSDQVTDFGSGQVNVWFQVRQIGGLTSTSKIDGFISDIIYSTNYFSDFESDTIAVQAPDTTKTWTTTNVTYNVVAGKYLKPVNTVAGYKALSFDEQYLSKNIQVKTKVKYSSAGGTSIVGTYIILHGISDSGIIAYVSDDLTTLGIAYNNNGTLENDITTTKTIHEDIFYHSRVIVELGVVKFKMWKAHLNEPKDWDVVNRIDNNSVGFTGIGQNSTSLVSEIDHILIEEI